MAMRNRNYLILPVTAGICAVIALLIILSDRQKKKKLEKSMAALEQRGQLLNAWNELNPASAGFFYPGKNVFLSQGKNDLAKMRIRVILLGNGIRQ